MSQQSFERQLEELAFGEDWKFNSVERLIASVDSVQSRIAETVSALRDKWQGEAAELALARLETHARNLGVFRGALNQVQALVTGVNENACFATSANQGRKERAQSLLHNLPSGVVPNWLHDAVNQGKTVEVPFFGTVDLNGGTEAVANFFGANREQAAQAALDDMAEFVQGEIGKLNIEVEYEAPPVSTGSPGGPEKWNVTPGGGSPSGRSGPGGHLGGGAGFPGGPEWPYGPGDNGGKGDGNGNDGGGTGTDPNLPEFHWDPPVVDPPYDPNDPGNGGGGGSEGAGGGSGSRPSVDSNLDGSAVRSGLGAAGLGAAGLAAGARLAAGAGGSGAGGGLGQGLAGLTGGLRGAAAAASTGGGGAGAAGAASAARGARPGGMMMGGGAGGSEKKHAKKSGLGGYIAPHLDDEGDGGPAADASRAGSRGDGMAE